MHALLRISQALYCRPTALLNGHLRLRHVSAIAPTSTSIGGLVLWLPMPKGRKHFTDRRLESFPIPTGPASEAFLKWLEELGLLDDGADPDAIVFPNVSPATGRVRWTALKVGRANDVLRKHVFVPAGVPCGARLTLRGIRSGASTDAAAAGVSKSDCLAQGGWRSEEGAKTYFHLAVAALTATNIPSRDIRCPGIASGLNTEANGQNATSLEFRAGALAASAHGLTSPTA